MYIIIPPPLGILVLDYGSVIWGSCPSTTLPSLLSRETGILEIQE